MIGIHTFVLALVLATTTITRAICPSAPPTHTITIAGSTTVQPFATAWGAAYSTLCPGATVTVSGGGSSSGAKRVCGVPPPTASPVDIGTMSRAWKTTEASIGTPTYTYNCAIGIRPTVTQIDVAIDGIVVILKKGSLPATCIAALGGLTFHQLRWIFSSYTTTYLISVGMPLSALPNNDYDDTTHYYSELSASCPKIEIKLVGPTSVFGTHTYFLETILTGIGETFRTACYFGTTSGAATITKVKSDPTGASIGYVSYHMFNKVKTTISAVSLKNSAGYIIPTPTTIGAGTYPLSRCIYMNILSSTCAKTKAFIEHGMSTLGTANVIAQGFSPIPVASRAIQNAKLPC